MTAVVTTVPAIWTGTVFTDKYTGEVYKAKKCNPVNIKSLGMDGKTWNVPWTRTREATEEETARFAAWEAGQAKPEPLSIEMFMRAGNVVRFKDPAKPAQQGMFVVTRVKAEGYSLVRLGGDPQSRYFPTVYATHLEKVSGSVNVKNV